MSLVSPHPASAAWSAVMAVTLVVASVIAMSSPGVAGEPKWEDGSAYEADGVKVTLSKPRLVHRSQGFLWFPSLHRLSNGRLLCVYPLDSGAA